MKTPEELAEAAELRKRIQQLTAQLEQEKEHHEFYRKKVSDFMGANQYLAAQLSTIRKAATAIVEQVKLGVVANGLNPHHRITIKMGADLIEALTIREDL